MKIKYNRLPDTVNVFDLLHIIARKKVYSNSSNELISYFINYFKFQNFIMTGSGRQALLIALQQTAHDKDEVIMPSYGCPIVPLTVIAAKKKPVYVDIEPETFAPNLKSIVNSLSKKTAAVILVHEFGGLVRKELIKKLRANFKGIIIEDAAVSLGSKYSDGTGVGQYSDFTIFSGSLGKPISSCSWGGLGVMSPEKIKIIPNFTDSSKYIKSILKIVAYSMIQNPLIFNSLLPFINRMVKKDATNVESEFRIPSQLDCSLMLNALHRNETEIHQLNNYAISFIKLINSLNYKTMKIDSNIAHFSRIPFYTKNREEREIMIKFFHDDGIEINKPFQYNFSSASKDIFPNAFAAINRLVSITLKRSYGLKFADSFYRTLSRFV